MLREERDEHTRILTIGIVLSLLTENQMHKTNYSCSCNFVYFFSEQTKEKELTEQVENKGKSLELEV